MSDLVKAFRAAETAAANAASDDWKALYDAREGAARALIVDAAGRHHIEERAVVYLVMGPAGWVIDDPTFDGSPCAGYDDGPLNSECDHGVELNAECDALRDAAARIDGPTPDELVVLLQAAAGE